MTATLARARAEGVFYLLVLPFAALTLLFGLWPILLSVQVSFTASATALRPDPQWVWLANYAAVLGDTLFLDSLWRTLAYTAMAVVANLAFALAAAMLLDGKLLRRGNMVFRLALFLPVVVLGRWIETRFAWKR